MATDSSRRMTTKLHFAKPAPTAPVCQRPRRTDRRVVWADRAARSLITLAGLGTIGAVLMVGLFLLWVVWPLFRPQRLIPTARAAISLSTAPLQTIVDERGTMVAVVFPDGHLDVYRTDTGQRVAAEQLFRRSDDDRSASDEARRRPAWTFSPRRGTFALALENGQLQIGRIGFKTSFLPDDQVPPRLRRLFEPQQRTGSSLRNLAHDVKGPEASKSLLDTSVAFRGGILQRTPEGQYRLQQLEIEQQSPIQLKSRSPVVLLDQAESPRGRVLAYLTQDGQLHVARAVERKNMLTGQVTVRLLEGTCSVPLPGGELPEYLLLNGPGDNVFLIWSDGRLLRYSAAQSRQPVLAETTDVVQEPSVRVTAVTFLAGRTSLAVGDTAGRIRTWFLVKPKAARTPDGSVLVCGHKLAAFSAPVRSLAGSTRSRLLAAVSDRGHVRVFYVTNEHSLASVTLPRSAGPVQSLTIAPRDDRLFVLTNRQLFAWTIDAPHPEVTVGALLTRVWYEGHTKPEHVWQTSSGADEFEPKYGLMPLIFGTLKGAFYSLLLGAPLAMLAAIYTSEFMSPKTKALVKPTIELMASLPSVVLGFLAALIFAPVAEKFLPELLLAFVTVPFAYLFLGKVSQIGWPKLNSRVPFSHAPHRLKQWALQTLPQPMKQWLGRRLLCPVSGISRSRRWQRTVGIILALPAGLWLAAVLGPSIERAIFAGDIMAWLDQQKGSGLGAWLLILLPVNVLMVVFTFHLWLRPALRPLAKRWRRQAFAVFDLLVFLGACMLTVALTYGMAAGLTAVGWDPRGTFVGTYMHRNALIVGFVMGFAIIPIIYTIAEDALSAVPSSLRAASLAAGATPWQTAVRVVVPTAASGLFSALMIGLGRAVGETMIVLMASGNTPLMDWNVFNGFRTLSATIAVELPEAVKDSTHYRVLFIAALTLFVLTFLINTAAEVIRLRFRKRALQL